jgi:excisionase family DNA binding protein
MLLNVKQVAERLSVSESKIYRLVEAGELPHHRIGGAIRFSEEQLSEFLQGARRERTVRKLSRPRLKHIKL